MYKLEYLPTARQDMIGIARYITRNLANPEAAEKLSVELIEAADSLSAFPYANPAYIPIKPVLHEYRKFLVQNYLIFYRVDEKTKTVTVTRVIYARRDHEKLL
jgi:addiction module RelE/StbE family toxin